jgi:hypothetical protein
VNIWRPECKESAEIAPFALAREAPMSVSTVRQLAQSRADAAFVRQVFTVGTSDRKIA